MICASDQRAACWAGFVSRSAASTTASIGKGRRLKSMMNINEDMADLLSSVAIATNEVQWWGQPDNQKEGRDRTH